MYIYKKKKGEREIVSSCGVVRSDFVGWVWFIRKRTRKERYGFWFFTEEMT